MDNEHKKVITLGEIMLRLKSPGFERLLQSPYLEATFGGGEANVAISLANFGIKVSFVTILPNNPIAEACIAFLRSKSVDTSFILREGERIGIYFLESGANQRPSLVTYDRSNSSLANFNYKTIDWDKIFNKANWFHITGITPAISQNAADLALAAVKAAKQNGLTISCDFNFRKNLWKYGKTAIEVMTELVNYADIGIANEEDCQLALGITLGESNWETKIVSGEINTDKYYKICERMLASFPNLKIQAITLRQSISANQNGWSGCLHDGERFYIGPHYIINDIVDRVGAGDAFSSGLIFGLISEMSHQDALNFAVASSCLKHSIPGDSNLVSALEVFHLLSGDTSGRVKR